MTGNALAIVLVSIILDMPALCTLCSCGYERDARKARAEATAVLEGIALDSTPNSPSDRDALGGEWFSVRVAVRRVWKGSVADTVEVLSLEGRGGCGFGFQKGERYLLFLYSQNRVRSGSLHATFCSLSQHWGWGTADSIVRVLGPPLRRGAT